MTDVLERDAGFCSGGDDDDMEAEDGIHSPTDASEDSVDVKVQAISLRNKNKRKCAEPRRVDTDLPAKKRKIDLIINEKETTIEASSCSPFRPWSASPPSRYLKSEVLLVPRLPSPPPHPSVISPSPLLPVPLTLYPQDLSKLVPSSCVSLNRHQQDEPLSLVSKKKDENPCKSEDGERSTWHTPTVEFPHKSNSSSVRERKLKTVSERAVSSKLKTEESDNKFRIDSLLSSAKSDSSSTTATPSKPSQGGQQRNYKNMTRERRIEANARERTRVHTISAAFDTLRHSIPAYSHNQKLSKLSVLRIACSYIMTLSRIAGYDYSKDKSEPEVSDCVENVSRTIQTEGKIRKKKDD